METLGINDGHTLKGFGTGAVGIINEGEHTRLVGTEIRRLIVERGHRAINCTVDYANSVMESLSLIMDQANRQDLDWFITIHFNAGGGNGVEVYTYEGRQFVDAIDVCKNISSLGFVNRGVKDGKGLYVIRKTVAKSMLIEVCFVDTDDANKYLQVGYKAVAKAIVDALVGDVVVPIINIKKESEENEMVANLVIFGKVEDQAAAEFLANKLNCPTMYSERPYSEYEKFRDVICVGATAKGNMPFTSYCTKLIQGSNRDNTMDLVQEYAKSLGK
jgi:hypothetical protein